jgi:hypothetical protein
MFGLLGPFMSFLKLSLLVYFLVLSGTFELVTILRSISIRSKNAAPEVGTLRKMSGARQPGTETV